MATYNLNYSRLDSLLDRNFSAGTENAIIQAIQDAGLLSHPHDKVNVEVESSGGDYTIVPGIQVFLATGSNSNITLSDFGHKIIGAGDGDNSILDKGPGGDTLLGGSGEERLQVTHGHNLLDCRQWPKHACRRREQRYARRRRFELSAGRIRRLDVGWRPVKRGQR